MANVNEIVEEVIVDTNECVINDDEDDIDHYYINEILKRQKIQLGTIIKWECQLIKFAYNIHFKGISVCSIEIDELMLDSNLDIVGDTIVVSTRADTACPEALAINGMLRIHESLLQYIILCTRNTKQQGLVKLLYNISNYYYAASINFHSVKSVSHFLTAANKFSRMVTFGMIEQIYNSL